jgi:hypothetical protein
MTGIGFEGERRLLHDDLVAPHRPFIRFLPASDA